MMLLTRYGTSNGVFGPQSAHGLGLYSRKVRSANSPRVMSNFSMSKARMNTRLFRSRLHSKGHDLRESVQDRR